MDNGRGIHKKERLKLSLVVHSGYEMEDGSYLGRNPDKPLTQDYG